MDCVSRETLAAYAALVLRWSEKNNLVSRGTLNDIWCRHIMDSAQILDLIENKSFSIADFGSGAGFPGVVLSIMGCEDVTLVEKDEKKCSFLRTVSAELGLPFSILNDRIEKVQRKWFYIVSRACAPLELLLRYSKSRLEENGSCIFLKGKKWEEEVVEAKKKFSFHLVTMDSATCKDSKILIVSHIQ